MPFQNLQYFVLHISKKLYHNEVHLHFYPVTVVNSNLITGCLINFLISGQCVTWHVYLGSLHYFRGLHFVVHDVFSIYPIFREITCLLHMRYFSDTTKSFSLVKNEAPHYIYIRWRHFILRRFTNRCTHITVPKFEMQKTFKCHIQMSCRFFHHWIKFKHHIWFVWFIESICIFLQFRLTFAERCLFIYICSNLRRRLNKVGGWGKILRLSTNSFI